MHRTGARVARSRPVTASDIARGPLDYKIAFDVSSAGYKTWPFSLVGLILALVGALLVRFRAHVPMRGPRVLVRAFPFVFFGFAILWTIVAFGSTFTEYWSLRSAVRDGRVSIVEGAVSQFKAMPYTGHAMERFCVQDTCFEYSDYVVTSGFNNTRSHGGPIREGLQVRIAHVRGTIVRLEVAEYMENPPGR